MTGVKIGSKRKKELQKLQKTIGYLFNNESLLNQSLVHRSYANEQSTLEVYDNERLEFLGDSILGMIVSNFLFNEYRKLSEGELSKYRAKIVCEESLAEIGKAFHLGEYVLLGKGERSNGGKTRNSILADTLEALIGAMYLDGGMAPVQRFVLQCFFSEGRFEKVPEDLKDHKTMLQEIVQKNGKEPIAYHVVREWGPDHDKRFEVQVLVGGKVIGTGTGKTKKEAEQQAAFMGIRGISKETE